MPMFDYGASFNCLIYDDDGRLSVDIGGGEDDYYTVDYVSNDLVALINAINEEHPTCVVNAAHELVGDNVDDHEVVAVVHLKDEPMEIVLVIFSGQVVAPKVV